MRRCDTIRGTKVEDRRKEEEMTTPITLPPMDELTLTELRRRDAGNHRCRNAHALPDALALAAGPDVEPDRPHCAAQPGHRGACAQTLLHGRIGCRPATYRPRTRANGHGCEGAPNCSA